MRIRKNYELLRGLLERFECQVDLISDWNNIYHIKITHELRMQHFTLLVTHSHDDIYKIAEKIMMCFHKNKVNNIINDSKNKRCKHH